MTFNHAKSDPIDDNVYQILKRQVVKKKDDPVRDSLDLITCEMLKTGIFDMKGQATDIGSYSLLFPKEYSDFKRQMGTKQFFYPYLQQVEFLVKGNSKTTIDVLFTFLQPQLRELRHKIKTSNGQIRFQPKSKIIIDNNEYFQRIESSAKQIVEEKDLYLERVISQPFSKEIHLSEKNKEEFIKNEKGEQVGKYIYEVPEIRGLITVVVTKIDNSSLYKVGVKIINNSSCKSTNASSYNDETVAKKCFYGTQVEIKCKNGSIVTQQETDENIKNELKNCSIINTSSLLSKDDQETIFANPVIIHDFPRHNPVVMSVSLKELAESEKNTLKHMDKLGTLKSKFVDDGFLSILHKVMVALSKTNPDKIKFLHKFQWDAIQLFVKKILTNDNKPLMIRAPTDSGKSIIFYVCAVLMILFKKINGTSTFITFPTRALNSQQFSEMVGFFYHLNKMGLNSTLGLYMGVGYDDKDAAVKTIWPPSTMPGQEIADIQNCPECGGDRLIAYKPDEKRVVPKCSSCGTELGYVYLSNMETESFCPNVVVGTPDKIINALTTSPFSQTIFGAPCKKCINCGRYNLLSWSNQNDNIHSCSTCKTELSGDTKTSSNPCFVIFDEIHTLSGTQGNLLGQFLSLMNMSNAIYGIKDDFWYLGATATIHNQKILVQNLTGFTEDEQEEFPKQEEYWYADGHGYFERDKNHIRHRYIVLDPVAKSTRGSVSNMALSGFSILNHLISDTNNIIKKLEQKGYDIKKAYKMQTVYVLRKSDGRSLEKYIPDLAPRYQMDRPMIKFGSGDLQRTELVKLNRLVKEQKLDVLVVTQIYGQGVDFPGLNIIHFFGMPRSFIELSQVVGRTGRGNMPGIVFLHMVSNIPRDQWIYKNFREIIEKLEDLYEPMPINVMNRYAISLSLPNILNSLIIARLPFDYKMRFADYVHKYFNNREKLKELVDQIYSIYLKPWIKDEKEITRLKKNIFEDIISYLLEFRASKQSTTDALTTSNLLLRSLRDNKKQIKYKEMMSYPILDELHASAISEEEPMEG